MANVQNKKKISKNTQVFESPYDPALQSQVSPGSPVKSSALG